MAVPWFLPGVAIAIGVAVLARRRVARWFGTSELLGWALVFTVGLIVAATLTPLRDGASVTRLASGCDFSRVGLAPPYMLRSLNDTSLNIVLFVPLGVVLGSLPTTRRKFVVIFGAAVLPIAIEASQLLATPLDRACQSADVIDNLSGLLVGLVIGTVIRLIVSQVDRPADRAGSR